MTAAIELGFCWTAAEPDPEVLLPRLKQCGFEAIELWPGPLWKHGAATWSSALASSGMRCAQLCPYFDLVHGPEAVAQSRIQLEQYLDAARLLSCKRLRVFTGPAWGEGTVGARDASETQWSAAIDGLQEFCDRAALDSVELCLECHEGSLMEDSASTLRLLRGVDRPNLTVNLQLPLRQEDDWTSVQALGPATSHIHIHNWTEALGRGKLTYLASGAYDWLPVLRYLTRDLGRSLCLSIEHPDHGEGIWKTAEIDGAFLHELRRRTLS